MKPKYKRDQLIQELRNTDNLLPQDILRERDLEELANQLESIFAADQTELKENPTLRSNFTELVNYIYLSNLGLQPENRKKDIFNDNLIAFLLSDPSPAG